MQRGTVIWKRMLIVCHSQGPHSYKDISKRSIYPCLQFMWRNVIEICIILVKFSRIIIVATIITNNILNRRAGCFQIKKFSSSLRNKVIYNLWFLIINKQSKIIKVQTSVTQIISQTNLGLNYKAIYQKLKKLNSKSSSSSHKLQKLSSQHQLLKVMVCYSPPSFNMKNSDHHSHLTTYYHHRS